MLDQATARQLAIIHINDIYNGSSASIGEQELLMMFLHLLHARRRSLDPVDVVARRADFDEQMRLVFEGESA
jgi:acyl-[acyl carrier protein]--UDP-N-acetylglucosamine O-acyltransferase